MEEPGGSQKECWILLIRLDKHFNNINSSNRSSPFSSNHTLNVIFNRNNKHIESLADKYFHFSLKLALRLRHSRPNSIFVCSSQSGSETFNSSSNSIIPFNAPTAKATVIASPAGLSVRERATTRGYKPLAVPLVASAVYIFDWSKSKVVLPPWTKIDPRAASM